MAKNNTADIRLAARSYARYTINLQRAFCGLLSKLKRTYETPAADAAEMRIQHIVALQAVVRFLDQVGPDGDLANFANQSVGLAQRLQDVQDGIPALIFTPTLKNRSDQTMMWLARARVALAVETMRLCGDSRKDAAKSVAKDYPDLRQLITERGSDINRGKSLEKAIISWCGDFSSHKVKNHFAAQVYSVGLGELKALEPNFDSDQKVQYARYLLQEALRPVI
jgi:hypothetical protein